MPTTYLPADDDTLALAEIVAAHHPHLEQARIAIVFSRRRTAYQQRQRDAGPDISGQFQDASDRQRTL